MHYIRFILGLSWLNTQATFELAHSADSQLDHLDKYISVAVQMAYEIMYLERMDQVEPIPSLVLKKDKEKSQPQRLVRTMKVEAKFPAH
jgi:hypothetical protein